MANTLVSPGVSISVIDESMYISSGNGTVPLIAIATASNKYSVDGSTIAPGTSVAGKVDLLTSQRDLLIRYGKPSFKVVDGTPIHGYETNEYGLMTAYSYLGLANRAYVVRADLDLSQLDPSPIEPSSDPMAGTYWLDTASSRVGLFVSNDAGSAYSTWDPVDVMVVPDDMVVTDPTYAYAPSPDFGGSGDYAWVSQTTMNQIWYNDSGTWFPLNDSTSGSVMSYGIADVTLGTNGAGYSQGAIVVVADPTLQGGVTAMVEFEISTRNEDGTGGEISIIGIDDAGSGYETEPEVTIVKPDDVAAVFSGVVGEYTLTTTDTTGIYSGMTLSGSTGLGNGYDTNTVVVESVDSDTQITVRTANAADIIDETLTCSDVGDGAVIASVTLNAGVSVGVSYVVNVAPHYEIPEAMAAGEYWFKTTSPNQGFLPSLKKYIIANGQVVGSWQFAQSAVLAYPDDYTADENGQNVINRVYALTTPGSASFSLRVYTSDGWDDLVYEAGTVEPRGNVAVGTLWYNDEVSVDLYRKGPSGWEPIDPAAIYMGTDSPASPSPMDIWIDTNDAENYPVIYEFDGADWVLHDNSDQTTPNGCVFADLTLTPQDNTNAGGASLIHPEYGPDPLFYPTGILCWNSALSTGNVKRWNGTYWETESGNVDAGPNAGAPYMLRKAQRRVVVKRLIAALELPELTDETVNFTLMCTPGYIECLAAMINLNVDRKETAFIIADTPLRLASYGASVQNWVLGTQAGEDGEDGLVTHDTYSAIYYPSVLTSDLDGNDAVLPASYTVLRTYAYNDQVAYPWFAPAGLQRGVASNAANFGYVNASNEFVNVALNQGQRDNLYQYNVNPLVFFPGQGLFVFGQKTLHPYASALDRVNVVRLICYLRAQFEPIARPFLFEPNDTITRTTVQLKFTDFLTNMISKRAIYDFLVVCDTSNNTPSRIDANELYIDIAIAPEKAIEFIYIPIRVVNTGAIGNTVTAANLAMGG